MPIHTNKDTKGSFYQWGATGKKYYYTPNDKKSREKAKGKAEKQEKAIILSGYKGK